MTSIRILGSDWVVSLTFFGSTSFSRTVKKKGGAAGVDESVGWLLEHQVSLTEDSSTAVVVDVVVWCMIGTCSSLILLHAYIHNSRTCTYA